MRIIMVYSIFWLKAGFISSTVATADVWNEYEPETTRKSTLSLGVMKGP